MPEVIRLRYAGRCGCGERLAEGDPAGYLRTERRVVCLHCMTDQQAGRVDLGTAERLRAVADHGVLALHDRWIPGRRANINHLAVGPAGVYVIDAKRYENAEIRVRRVGGPFTPRREELLVRGQVRTSLVDGLSAQVGAVREALESGGQVDVAVTPVLCFVDGLFPLSAKQLRVGSTLVVGPSELTRLVASPGPLGDEQRYAIYCLLGDRLRSMT